MTTNKDKERVVWDTSAISRLARLDERDDLIERMHSNYVHWITGYALDEIAATTSKPDRNRLLLTCKRLVGGGGRFLIHPSILLIAGITMFWEIGYVDWEVLLEGNRDYDRAMTAGIFDDDLATLQRPQLAQKLLDIEKYFSSMKPSFSRLFQIDENTPGTLDEFVAKARSLGIIEQNIRYSCESILDHKVDNEYVERFTVAFPPIEAKLCAFLIGHFYRNLPLQPTNQAGGLDLYAAAYLPLCDKYISDDRDQQHVLRDVVRCCSLTTEVAWFYGDFRKRFSKLPA